MSTPGTLNITLYYGASHDLVITFEKESDGTDYDISTYDSFKLNLYPVSNKTQVASIDLNLTGTSQLDYTFPVADIKDYPSNMRGEVMFQNASGTDIDPGLRGDVKVTDVLKDDSISTGATATLNEDGYVVTVSNVTLTNVANALQNGTERDVSGAIQSDDNLAGFDSSGNIIYAAWSYLLGVIASATQTLTNKTIDANNNTLSWGSSTKTTEDDSKAIIQKSDGTSETIRWDDLQSNMNDWQSTPGYRKLWQKIYNIGNETGDQNWRVLQIGDSLSSRLVTRVADVLNRSYGTNTKTHYGLGGDGGINTDGLLFDPEGSAIRIEEDDFELSISGTYYQMDASTNDAFKVYENSSITKEANTIKIYYLKENGAGSFKVQTSNSISSGYSDEAGYTNIDCDNSGARELGITTISKASDNYAIRLEALSGVVKIIGVGMYDDSRPDGYYWNTNQGGLNSANLDSDSQLIIDLIEDFNPDLITYFFNDDASSQDNGLSSLKNWIDNANINTPGVIAVANHTRDGMDSEMLSARKKVIEKSIQYGWMYYDAWRASGGAYEELQNIGWEGDGVHLNIEAYEYFSQQIINELGLPETRYSKIRQLIRLEDKANSITSLFRRLDITKDADGVPALKLYTDNTFGSDALAEVGRTFQVIDDDGNVRACFSRNIASRPNRLPPKIYFGVNTSASDVSSFPSIIFDDGSPEGTQTAEIGSFYLRTDGGSSTTLYVKESGSGNTGWVAK